MRENWPKQSQCDAFYGNPRNGGVVNETWRRKNIVAIPAPWPMQMGNIKITRLSVHAKCAEAYREWLEQVRENFGGNALLLHGAGMTIYSGGFNYRLMRGGNSLSMHAYGCALDFDAPRNGLGNTKPNFLKYLPEIVEPFEKLGGVWGGRWRGKSCDGMHFQFAIV